MKPFVVAAAVVLMSCVGPGAGASGETTPGIAPQVPPAVEPWLIEGEPRQGALIRGRVATGTAALSLDGRDVRVAADGRFVIGFDRDAPAAAVLTERRYDGSTVSHPLSVAVGAWRIEQVNAPYRAGRSDAEFEAVRPGELAQIAAARALAPDAEGWRQRFRWPATGRQSGWFGAQRVYRGKPGGYHGGADIAVPTGTPLVAPADGVVILAATTPFTLEGRLLMIDHGHGLSSALLHLSRIDVTLGARVRQGQVVGLSGATGRVSGPHLHWGLQWRGAKLDPLKVAGVVLPR